MIGTWLSASRETVMQFIYADPVRLDFPELATGVLHIDGITKSGNVSVWTAHFCDIASVRLGNVSETALPEIQAWRRAFGRPRGAGPPGLIGHTRGTVRSTLAAR